MREIFDEYCWTKHKKIITKDRHGVPGLGNVSFYDNNFTEPPAVMHFHSNIIEIHCVVKGARYTQIQESDRISTYLAHGNQALITFPFELHGNGDMPVAPCSYYAYQIDISDKNYILGLNKDYSVRLCDLLHGLKSRCLALPPSSLSETRRIFELFSEMKPESTMFACSLLVCFLMDLVKFPPVECGEVRPIADPILRAIRYIENNLSENIRLSRLAEQAGYSLSHFKVRFKEELGITPAEYITFQKVEAAKKLLGGSSDPVTDVAYALGYSSSSYFCYAFRKVMGCSPIEYRRAAHGVR